MYDGRVLTPSLVANFPRLNAAVFSSGRRGHATANLSRDSMKQRIVNSNNVRFVNVYLSQHDARLLLARRELHSSLTELLEHTVQSKSSRAPTCAKQVVQIIAYKYIFNRN